MPLIDFNKLNKYYQVHVRCTNCGQIQDLKVPKGEKKESFLKNGKCDNCGCFDALVLREEEIRKEAAEKDKNEKPKPKPKLMWS